MSATHNRFSALAIGVILGVTLLCTASPALAASTVASQSAPVASGPVSVQIGPGEVQGATVAIVDVTLDPSVKLPARVRLPIPPGATIVWAGEILGGEASADPERPFTIHDGTGGQYAEFTISQSRQAQIDTNQQGFSASGTTRSGSVDFVQSVPSTSTTFSVRMPAGISAVQISPAPAGPPQTNSAGESLYAIAPMSLAPGQKVTVKISYNTVAASAASGSNNTGILVAVGVATVAIVIAVVLLVRRPGAGSDEEVDEAEDEGDADWGSEDEEIDPDEEDAGAGSSADDLEDDDPFSTAD